VTERLQAYAIGLALFLAGPLAALAPLGLAPLAGSAGVLVAGLALVRERRQLRPPEPITLMLLALAGLGGLSALWSVNPARSLAAAAGLLALLGPGPLLVRVAAGLPAERRQRIADALLAGLALGLAIMLGQRLLRQGLIHWLTQVPWPGYLSPKLIGRPATVLALLSWPAAVIVCRRGRGGLAPALPALAALAALALWHRASIVAVAAGLLVLAAARTTPERLRRGMAGLLVLAFAAAVPLGLAGRTLGLEQAEWLASSARHRIEIWGFAADRVLDRPLSGYGLDASGGIDNHGQISRFQGPEASIIPLHPHNLFLQTWLELGAAGAALGLAICLTLLAAIGRLEPPSRPYALAGFACWWVILGLSYGAWQTWWLGATLLAATALAVSADLPPRNRP
jgi:O-antigen ligase